METIDNNPHSRLENIPIRITFKDYRLRNHFISTEKVNLQPADDTVISIEEGYANFVEKSHLTSEISSELSNCIFSWLETNITFLDESNKKEVERFNSVKEKLRSLDLERSIQKNCEALLPKFILFSNYFRIRPTLHLGDLTNRIKENRLDGKYDYGNICLLKYLGFTPSKLSKADIDAENKQNFEEYRKILDNRDYQLNSATIKLTNAIQRVWNPNTNLDEASKLKIKVDGQYLKVVVEDELDVEVELDQRSEGFQWLVSFFIDFCRSKRQTQRSHTPSR